MGCGASVKGTVLQEPDAQPVVTATWATKKELPLTTPTKSSSASLGSSRAMGSPARGQPQRAEVDREPKCLLMDLDDESEIEVIYEGKPRKASQHPHSAANAQEAPDAAESLVVPEARREGGLVAPSRSLEAKPWVGANPVLPKMQADEAAKLAEQRKRFDNQRYQRDGFVSSSTPLLGPQSRPIRGGGVVAVVEAAPRHDMVMGLNLTPMTSQDPWIDDLPGGIGEDSPRASPLPKCKMRNQHDVFDDDDEMLMKEILASVDA